MEKLNRNSTLLILKRKRNDDGDVLLKSKRHKFQNTKKLEKMNVDIQDINKLRDIIAQNIDIEMRPNFNVIRADSQNIVFSDVDIFYEIYCIDNMEDYEFQNDNYRIVSNEYISYEPTTQACYDNESTDSESREIDYNSYPSEDECDQIKYYDDYLDEDLLPSGCSDSDYST
ncbi:hypothetical protein A3Q56_07337 [Intoshia linei]|uniref:RNA polymerase II nuclear localization protein SLC7A6OS n=1 Tax=Intoshia linei TaxID=1819745 RepID=A0A177AU93_9BILA|nr:hypothetical protein A3Q56_07337 [Intoshia linei]